MSDDDAELKRKTDEVLLIAAGLMKTADVHEIALQLSVLIDSVANDEREACAVIADNAHDYWKDKAPNGVDLAAALDIAAAIRARGTET